MSNPDQKNNPNEKPQSTPDSQSPSSPLSFDGEEMGDRLSCLFAQEKLATLCRRVLEEFEICFPRPPGQSYERLRKALYDLTEFCDEPGLDELNERLKAIVKRLVGEEAYASLRLGDASEFASAFKGYAIAEKSQCHKEWGKFARRLKRVQEQNESIATAVQSEAERERLSRTPEPLRLSERQKCILDALDGVALTTSALAEKTGYSDTKLFKSPGLKELKEHGLVRNLAGFGYFRPDSPPPDVVEAFERGSY